MHINNVKIIEKQPFVIGCCDSLLSEDQVESLRHEMLLFFQSNKGKFNITNDQKFSFNNASHPHIYEVMLQSMSSKNCEFIRLLESKELQEEFLAKLWVKVFFNRLDRFSLDILLFKVFRGQYFKTVLEFSFMPVGSKIVPHTDAVRKIMTAQVYLPSKSEQDQHLGINFYDYPVKNNQNHHYVSQDQQQLFYKNARRFVKPLFENCFYFFMKNSRSWHDVDSIDNLPNDYVRVSINYNILLDETIFRKLLNILKPGELKKFIKYKLTQ